MNHSAIISKGNKFEGFLTSKDRWLRKARKDIDKQLENTDLRRYGDLFWSRPSENIDYNEQVRIRYLNRGEVENA